ncbi:N-acetyltransferase ESCO2 [Toxocara canis]|uniref:N-acetyltransferase ESCO2 n=1 Tax=Toxocara canis TaxID=6265 RepID=A0A0B2VP60_TOXCA|nr:N-acetyltransferase ESCO2 [Toxocara canis]
MYIDQHPCTQTGVRQLRPVLALLWFFIFRDGCHWCIYSAHRCHKQYFQEAMPQKQLTDFFSGVAEGSSLSQNSNPVKTHRSLYFVVSPRPIRSRKRKLSIDDITQMTLDAGQRRIGTQRCNKCEMVYDIDCMRDKKAHNEYHNRFTATSWFRVTFAQIDNWKNELCFAVVEGGYIFNIKASAKCALKKRLEKVVLECVNKELGYTPDLADVWDKTGLREAWVFISDTEMEYPFIGGILLVDALKKARRLLNQVSDRSRVSQDAENESCDQRAVEVHGNLMGVNRVWVHPCVRRKGIAFRLVERARAHFLGYGILPRERVAFSEPTIDGLAFASKYSKEVLVYGFDDVLRA